MPIMGALLSFAGRFERVEEHPRDVESALLRDFLEAGGAGDVDLREKVADDVQADEEQPLARELGPERLRDLEVAFRKRLGDPGAARREIAARLARFRDAREAVRHGLA